MAKGNSRVTKGTNGRKNHGPKRHLFNWTGALLNDFAKAGVLNKYNNYESFQLACAARGKRSVTYEEFEHFSCMSRVDQDAYLADLKK